MSIETRKRDESCFEIRKAVVTDARAIAEVHVDSWHTTYRGIVADEFLANLSYDQRELKTREQLQHPSKNRCTFVATVENRIVGWATVGELREEPIVDPSDALIKGGELYAIYLLKSHQRMGIGRRLFDSGMRHLVEMGHQDVLVWVLKQNPACHFYEAVGGRYLLEQPITIGDQTFSEVAYVYRDIVRL